MNRITKIVIAALGGILLLICALLAAMIFTYGCPKQYITTDIADYGKYTGNYDDEYVQQFVNAFFPDEIEAAFSNVQYSYRAQKGDTYAFEAYLSFTIEDKSLYDAFVKSHTDGIPKSVFRYDNAYEEYMLFDELELSHKENESRNIHIRYAKIKKILCCPEKQEIIFVALGVYDGGIVKTDFLCNYFDRFCIDPREYALNVIPSYS